MCEDCLRLHSSDLDQGLCACTNCRAGGFVVAIDWTPDSGYVGRAPWCSACHHYISPSGSPARK